VFGMVESGVGVLMGGRVVVRTGNLNGVHQISYDFVDE